MKFFPPMALRVFALVLLWRLLLLIFTVQPIPSSDAYDFDGAVINYLHGGRYCNPCLSLQFPISGRELFTLYPPVYQGVLLLWMKLFGAGMISAMVLHLGLFAISGLLTLAILRQFFPPAPGQALAALLFFGFTFVDRPESLAYVFGLGALWLVLRQLAAPGFRPGIAAALALILWLALYTSVIVGAYFFGIGLLTCVAACAAGVGTAPPRQSLTEWLAAGRRNWHWFAPFFAAAALFALVTLAIMKLEPLWWAGFMENARVATTGWHLPTVDTVLKMIRTAPVFLVALALLPLLAARRQQLSPGPWLALCAGILVAGWGLLAASVTLLSPNYSSYVAFSQILLAAGLLALAETGFPGRRRCLRAALLACAVLVSVRAIGITTWGVACAWKNSYAGTQTVLRTELQPFLTSDQPVLLSCAFLYGAADLGVKNPVHCDWYFDHAHWTNNAQTAALARLRPPKLVLTQFDYYRGFERPLAQLRQSPGLVDIRVRNLAALPVPDAHPALQRVLQHISWAPVIVDLDWHQP